MRSAPGWYGDPARPGALRYWDGRRWTGAEALPATNGRFGFARERFARPAPAVPGPAPPPGLPGLPMAVAGFAAGAGLSFVVLLLLDRAGSPGGVAMKLGLSEIVLWAGMLAPVFYSSRRYGVGRLSVDFNWTVSRIDIGLGLLGALAGRSAVSLASIVLAPAYEQLQHQPAVGLPADEISGITWLVFGIIVCVGAPVIEELFFRGLIQTRLVGMLGAGWGIAITSVVFGAGHLIGWQDPSSLIAALILACGGAVLGFLRYRTGRLGTSTIAHSLFNSMAFAILLLGATS